MILKKVIITITTLVISTSLYASNIDKVKIFTENYPPYNMEVNGEAKGISVDILDAMMKEMQSSKTINDVKFKPWASGYKITLKKKNTMLFSTTRTEQREELFKWVGPIVATKIGVIAKKSKNIKINNAQELNNYKIGAVLKDIGEQLLYTAGVKKENIDAIGGKNPIILNFKKMGKGRIDMFAYDINVAMYGAKSFQIDSREYEEVYVLKEAQLYYAFNKNTDDNIIKAYQNALDKIKSNGIYKKIIAQYQ